ncbi:AGE family epimerase/isomerase [Dysgonomonas termitidis]|uniref:Cellobiose 2-epimerase n=1 Tax=Dysgonomonas termitidis TaxID=1516126 RepID=A0ABV9L1D0_9BACT
MIEEFHIELTANILPFWMNKMADSENGGFYGRIDGSGILHKQANKGSVLNMRILWAFSAAYRILCREEYLEMANRAFDYIQSHFIDYKNGGVYWELNCKGKPVNTKKQVYAQGFALYAFSEYYRATQNTKALELSKEFFYLIEGQCKDKERGGYFEAFTEDWKPIDDMRLSGKDANEKKTMNTHLHILEPYTNLYRVWPDKNLQRAQTELIDIFSNQILNKRNHHLNLFFDDNWNSKSTIVSYGHDIEASWLLFEAADVLGDKKLRAKVRRISLRIVDAAMEGFREDGSLIYETAGAHADTDRHWWVQAEAVVGLMYAHKNSGDKVHKEKAAKTWEYIKRYLIDYKSGEWYWSVLQDGSINLKDDKAGCWKCPYHNGRMCMEMIEHFSDDKTN